MVKFEYSTEYIDMLVTAVALLILIYYFSVRYIKQRILRFGNFETLEKVAGQDISKVSSIPLFLRILSIVTIILIASDFTIVEIKPVTHTDFVLTMDTSSSMLTPDFIPNRLEATKNAALGWIISLEGTRVGIVTFAGKPYVKVKPIIERPVLLPVVRGIKTEQPAGTAIGDALVTSAGLLTGSKVNKTIVLITDGRNNVGVSINDSIKTLVRNDIRVYAIGVGTKGTKSDAGTPLSLEGLNHTEAEFPDLDEVTLKYLAEQTNGSFALVEDVQSLKDVLASTAEADEVKSSPKTPLLLLAVGLLLLEWSLEISKYRPIP